MVCYLTCSFHISSPTSNVLPTSFSLNLKHIENAWVTTVTTVCRGYPGGAQPRRGSAAHRHSHRGPVLFHLSPWRRPLRCDWLCVFWNWHGNVVQSVAMRRIVPYINVYQCMHCDGFNVPVIESCVVPFKYLVSHTFWKRWEATWSDTCSFAQTFAPLQPCCREVSSSWNLKQ